MRTFRLVIASAEYGSRKTKSKRRNGGTQALREEAAKSGAGGLASTILPQAKFFVDLAA